MSTNVTGTAHTPLGTPIPGGSDDTRTGNNSVGKQQHPGTIPKQGSGNCQSLSQEPGEDTDRGRTLGNVPASIAALTVCNKSIKDFHALQISKATALSRIYLTLVNTLPEDLSGVEEAFGCYIAIIENHEHHISEAEHHGNREHLKSPVE